METVNRTVSAYSISSARNLVPIKSRTAPFGSSRDKTRKLILVLVLFALLLLVALIALSVFYSKAVSNVNICVTEECIRMAASLKESMNTSADPCEDFYEYACGRWSQEHPMPDSSLTNSWFSERSTRVTRIVRNLLRENDTDQAEIPWAVAQAKKLYASCIDTEALNSLGLSPLQNLLKELNLPELPSIFSGRPGDVMEQLAEVKKKLGRDIFFGFDIFPDPRNKSRNVIILGEPTTSSPLPSDKELDKRLRHDRSRTRGLDDSTEDVEDLPISGERLYMTNVIREVTSNGTTNACESNGMEFPNETDIANVAKMIYRMSGKIYYLVHADSNDTSSSDEEVKDEDYMFVDELQRVTDEYVKEANSTLVPRQIWRPFLQVLLRDVPDTDLTRRDKLLVGNLDYLKEIAVLLSSIDDATFEVIIWWVVVDIVVPHSSENLRRAWSTYLSEITDAEVSESRSLHCANAVNQLMGMAVSWLFVDRGFHENIGPKVAEMLEDIRAAFATLVSKIDWMDGKTKSATLEKSRKMRSVIGHPLWLFEDGELDEYYEGINMTEVTYLDNMLQIIRLRCYYELQSLHDYNPENETFWATDPTDVNAFHTFQANQITVPAGILQFPFYELGLEALNYGAIGTVLGHELTHGFDNSGRQYDSFGNLRQWWTNETIDEYTDRTQCFVDHYNKYYEPEIDDYIDGDLTLGENIADNGGLREAVWAYKRWTKRHGAEPTLPGFEQLTSEQLLFLGFGHIWCESYTSRSLKWMLLDSHCPGHVRLTAAIKNSPEFGEAWNCPVESTMNPAKKCQLW